jgi:hypothetical protein
MKVKSDRRPRYHLDEYRKFIREAAPFMSLVAGRRIRPSEAETMSNEALEALALLVDQRAEDLKKRPLPGGGNNS